MEVNNNLLNNALEKAIKNHGTDVLKSPHLVNILQDYGAFDVHDANRTTVKSIIEVLVKEEYVSKLLKWRGGSEKKLHKHLTACIEDLHSKVDGSSLEMVTLIIEEVTEALGIHTPKNLATNTKEAPLSEDEQQPSIINTQALSYWENKISDHYQKAFTVSFNDATYIGDRIANGQESLVQELKNSKLDEMTESSIVHFFLQESLSAANSIYSTASIFHGGLNSAGRRKYGDKFLRASAAGMNINYVFGDLLETVFGGTYWKESVSAWENGIKLHIKLAPYLSDASLNIATITKYEWKIKKYNSSYISPKYDTTPTSLCSEEDGCSTLIVVFLVIAVLGLIVALVNGEL